MKKFAISIFLFAILVSCLRKPEDLAEKHVRRADLYAEQAMYREAVLEYKNAILYLPKNLDLRRKLAKVALYKKDLRTAVDSLETVVKLDPTDNNAKGKLGEIYLTIKTKRKRERLQMSWLRTYRMNRKATSYSQE